MSYDLRIWCVNRPDIAETVTIAKGKDWLVNAGVVACLAEDIPDDVVGHLPGIAHQVDLSLEPIDAPAAGKAAIWMAARAIAKAAHGVIEDPQTDQVELPSGVKRIVPIKHAPNERVSVLTMSWWFDHDRFSDRRSILSLVDALERWLPEAMPRRYGLYEPPQYELAKTGRDHLVEFLVANLTDTIVWYAHRPVFYVFNSISRNPGWIMHGGKQTYRCNRISIDIDAAVLEQPGWQPGLERAWRELSRLLHPFFGDVRTLRGHIARGRSFAFDSETESHPVKGWWWHGVPLRLGHAAVISEPYWKEWPELHGRTTPDENGLAFVSTEDWRSDADAADSVGGVPERLAIGFMPRTRGSAAGGGEWVEWFEDYPAIFPFPRP